MNKVNQLDYHFTIDQIHISNEKSDEDDEIVNDEFHLNELNSMKHVM